MCGIIGILGKKPVGDRLVDALKRLEYRGYDSAGIATVTPTGFARRRAAGKLVNLENKLIGDPVEGHSGIGHTRWATHGAPIEKNAHPHIAGSVSIVHNGIIENFGELKAYLTASGAAPNLQSDTDSEIIAHLIALFLRQEKNPVRAVGLAREKLSGAFAFLALFDNEPDLIIGCRNGPPLLAGGNPETGEYFIASDMLALSPFCNRLCHLHDGDMAVLRGTGRGTGRGSGIEILGPTGAPVTRETSLIDQSPGITDKAGYKHYMAKEIHEQPQVIARTLGEYIARETGDISLPGNAEFDHTKISQIRIIGCGTAYYAGLVGQYWIENIAKIPVIPDMASEFRYRCPPLRPDELALFISQSGETADSLAAMEYCRDAGIKTAAIVNVGHSSLARAVDIMLPTRAGPEIGVASTKAFTCQMAVLAALALHLARLGGKMAEDAIRQYCLALLKAPDVVQQTLTLEDAIKQLSGGLAQAAHALFLGRGIHFPLAMEGALKLKELSYIHAEGYAGGELKHGPISLIDSDLPVIALLARDESRKKMAGNISEVASRGGKIILIGDADGLPENVREHSTALALPDCPTICQPFAEALCVQLIAYHTANFLGTDIDQPRNLAKSVTVE